MNTGDLPQMYSSDSLLSSENVNELTSDEFELSKRGEETHKSLENIFLDGPTYAIDADTISITSHNESLLNFQIFGEENDLNFEKENDSNREDLVENEVETSLISNSQIDITCEELKETAVEGRTQVGFEEPKITKPLPTADSNRSLMKFFTDSPVGVGEDLDGKNFFDSFTTFRDEEGGLEMKTESVASSPSRTPQISMQGDVDVTTPFALMVVDEKLNVGEEEKKTNVDDDKNRTSENLERSRDAWLPSEKTRKSLLTVLHNGPNVIVPFPTSELTMPGIIIEESLGDPIRASMLKYIGEQEADKRLCLDNVPQDLLGLQQLIKADSLRSAVDLTSRLLKGCGQGPGKMNQLSTHTPYSLQLWFIRLSLLSRLNLYGPAECEWQPFAGLDNPDLYYEFHQSSYPGKKGSMVPFEMRVAHAEFPQYLQRQSESLDRLYCLLSVVNRIIKNLKSSLFEDGSKGDINDRERQECLSLWEYREKRVLYCIANCLLGMKDHNNSLKILKILLTKDPNNVHHLQSAMGRIYLQVGDVERARGEFSKISSSHFKDEQEFKMHMIFNEALVELGSSEFYKAMQLFRKVFDMGRQNILALNNMCVCLLYLERLKESLKQLEQLIYTTPELYLQEIFVLNLCTMYELESSKANIKKQNLLHLIGQHKGTGFNHSCLKLM